MSNAEGPYRDRFRDWLFPLLVCFLMGAVNVIGLGRFSSYLREPTPGEELVMSAGYGFGLFAISCLAGVFVDLLVKRPLRSASVVGWCAVFLWIATTWGGLYLARDRGSGEVTRAPGSEVIAFGLQVIE